jgi:hypothetical protein
VRERIYLCVLVFTAVDATETGESVLAVNVHGARAADTLSTRAAESECWVDFILDFDECIKSLRVGRMSRNPVWRTQGECKPLDHTHLG